FKDSQAGAMDQINTALARGDLELAERLAHTVKGVSGNIGAARLQAAAARLESELKPGNSGPDPGSLQDFKLALDDFMAALDVLTDEPQAAGPAPPAAAPPVDLEIIRPLVQRLNELLAEDDMEAEEVLEKLTSCLHGAAAELAEGVGRGLAGYDFEEALAKARELATQLGL
ncbi:MAG: Hpt domain-containing protein, partial [Pseudomonadota bacterium]